MSKCIFLSAPKLVPPKCVNGKYVAPSFAVPDDPNYGTNYTFDFNRYAKNNYWLLEANIKDLSSGYAFSDHSPGWINNDGTNIDWPLTSRNPATWPPTLNCTPPTPKPVALKETVVSVSVAAAKGRIVTSWTNPKANVKTAKLDVEAVNTATGKSKAQAKFSLKPGQTHTVTFWLAPGRYSIAGGNATDGASYYKLVTVKKAASPSVIVTNKRLGHFTVYTHYLRQTISWRWRTVHGTWHSWRVAKQGVPAGAYKVNGPNVRRHHRKYFQVKDDPTHGAPMVLKFTIKR